VQTENTPQSYKGIEAFILSYVPHDLYDQVGKAHLDPSFVEAYGKVATAFMKAERDVYGDSSPTEDYHIVNSSMKNSAPADNPTESKSRAADGPTGLAAVNLKDGVYTDDDDKAPGFLFLPAYLVHEPLVNRAIQDVKLVRAVRFGRLVASELQELSEKTIYDKHAPGIVQQYLLPAISQIYLISVEGANRIFNPHHPQPSAEYGGEFPGKTFFPSRPYFWPTLEDKELSKDVVQGEPMEKLFRVSRPYLDLAGNGVVITLCRPVGSGKVDSSNVNASKIEAVLCIDTQLHALERQGMYADLTANVRSLGGTVAQVTCAIDPRQFPHCPNSASTTVDQEELAGCFEDALSRVQSEGRSNVLGTVYVFDTPGCRTENARLKFLVPIKRDFPKQEATLLLVDVDLKAYHHRTRLYVVGATVFGGLLLSLLAYLWGSNVVRRRDFATALEEVATVMSNSPTPYLRLDSTDRIRDVSESTCTLLGYDADELKKKKFRSLCDEQSLAEYDRVEDLRNKGAPVDPYRLKLLKKNMEAVSVKVHSAAVPKMDGTGLPETFGILIPQ
jgi:PAS domain S-box-containing protein